MKLRLLAALFVLLGFVNYAHAQSTPVVLSGGCGTATYSHNPPYFTVDTTGKMCVNATVSASVTGFTPGGVFATLTATGSSASVALPAGTTVALQNTGTTTVSCTLGVGSATATTNEIQVPASSTVFVTPGSNTFGACIDQTGSASNLIVLAGGSGLGTGFGGGSSSGGGTVAQGNAGSNAQAWWAQIGDTARGPAKVQAGNSAATTDVALTVADPNVLAAVNAGVGTPGSAPPANVIYWGANTNGATGGLIQGVVQCNQQGFKHITTATDTQLVQGVASQTIRVCGVMYNFSGSAAQSVFLENTASANANCSSANTQIDSLITGSSSSPANVGFYNPIWGGLKNTSGNGLCLNSSGTGGVDVTYWYAQF